MVANIVIYFELCKLHNLICIILTKAILRLLFYYGMLTIKGTFGSQLILGIPNNNVRNQYYGFLLDEYQKLNRVSINNLSKLFTYKRST